MSRKRGLLAGAVAAAKTEPEAPAPESAAPAPQKRPRRPDPMAAREGALSDVASGRVRDVRLRLVDPKTCRMWVRHNRLYEHLSPLNCDDLISSIRAQGKQEIPALVRRLKNDPEGFEYEVISGARRHFAVSWLREVEHRREIFFLVEVRDLEDEEAFRFSDLENRNREDVSDYERGRDYLFALDAYYGGNMTRMAERMEVSKALLSSYLSVARLPEEVIAAYGDPREIAVRHGQQLSPLLKGDGATALLAHAREIAAAQAAAIEKTGKLAYAGAEVFKRLKAGPVAGAGESRPAPRAFGVWDGKPVLTALRKKNRLLLDVAAAADEDAIIAAVKAALKTA